jgi:hypothetical protein
LLGKTYHRKEGGAYWSQESYACVVCMTEEDAKRLDKNLYNELELTLCGGQCINLNKQLSLQLITEDFDCWWTAYLPYTGQDLHILWSLILELITPRATNDCDCWLCFTHRYFLQITKELGAIEYDYG